MSGRIILTEDGSHSLVSTVLDESYHSTHGAIQESDHIFIRAGLMHFLEKSETESLKILEIGFGTGLNALLTRIFSKDKPLSIEYHSIELYPVDDSVVGQLNFSVQTHTEPALFRELHECPWNRLTNLSDRFSLLKILGNFTEFVPAETYDLVYFDAFSPDKQAELWTEEQFRKVYDHLNPGAVLTTYCAKGQIRRNMQAAGFQVERLPGPPGKREILRASKIINT